VARGNREAVLAAARDAEPGQILLHNHPSGLLEPSPADLALAARLYEEGLGTGIVDNEARSLYVVVEPPAARAARTELDLEALEELLAPGGALAAGSSTYEDRPAQRSMMREVGERYNKGGIALVEAGTGTGKSLAYLLPAASWALRNGERTVISTQTINLQEQLVRKDLPLVRELLGGELSWTLVKGRGNYVSIRRLHLAAQSAPSLFEDDRSEELGALLEWVTRTQDGSLSGLLGPPSPEVWDEVRSDSDACMGARCPHFQACFYQRARREAASTHLIVANHALLFADVSLRRTVGNWSQPAALPAYRHVILDEGHNVEDAATSHLGIEVTRTGLFRILDRLDRRGKGVLGAVSRVAAAERGEGATDVVARVDDRIRPRLDAAREALIGLFDAIEPIVPRETDPPLRLGAGDSRDPTRDTGTMGRVDRLTAELSRLRRELRDLRGRIEEDESLLDRLSGRVLDLQAAERRLEGAERGLSLVLDPGEGVPAFVRWIEGRGRGPRHLRNVVFAAAPVEPGELLRDSLFQELRTVVVTSATLAVGRGGFGFMRERLGLSDDASAPRPGDGFPGWQGGDSLDPIAHDVAPHPPSGSAPPLPEVTETLLSSPFDYGSQTLFGVPTDLPAQDSGAGFQEATARVTVEFAEITEGGLFVLFTSHRALRSVAELLRNGRHANRWPLFVQGESPRSRLLDGFVRSERGILLGTASFWEGVDVPGRPLRGLVLQKLPFRVPTEPIVQARMEAIEAKGRGAFQSYLVPLAALRLKQGFGRLIRSRQDRGGILLLDSRILSRSYGRTLLDSLPEAPRVSGPWSRVRAELAGFYSRGCIPGSEG